MEQLSLINLDALATTPLNHEPYPFLIIENLLHPSIKPQLAADLPQISLGGSIPLTEVDQKGSFTTLISELESATFKNAIAAKLNMDLEHRPSLITYRAKARMKDGRIHTDSKSKLVTVLLYLNPSWEHEAGQLRVLRNGKNLEDYVAEIPPLMGRCLIFKVTDNCWHGHKPVDAERRSLQLNYVTDDDAQQRHINKHNLSAKIKNLFT